MINFDDPPPPAAKPTFGIGQMMFLVAWLGLAFGLIRASLSTPPRVFARCSEIAVSDSGKHAAAIHYDFIHLFRNGKYVDRFEVGQVEGVKFIDDETLAVVSIDGSLPRGIHYYSLAQREFVNSHLLNPKLDSRVRLLDDKFIVQQMDQQLVGEFHVYDMDAFAKNTLVSSRPSPATNMPFGATNDGRYIVFHFQSGLSLDFSTWDSMGRTFDYDLETGESTNKLKMSNGLAFGPDGSFVITCRSEITKLKWPSAERVWSIPAEEVCGRVRVSRDGGRFAVVTGNDHREENRFLRVYDTDSAEKLFEINLNESHGLGYSFSGDGKSIWVAGQDERGVLAQWDIASSSIVNQTGSSSRILSVAFYVLMFLLWSVLYVRLFPSRFPLPYKRGASIFMLLNSVFLLSMGCCFAFQSSSLTMVLSGFGILSGGNMSLVRSMQGLFRSTVKEPDTDSV